LIATANKKQADVVLVSEPSRRAIQGESWKVDLDGDAALRILTTEISPSSVGEEKGVVWVELQDIVLISCYFCPNKPIHEYALRLDKLSSIIRSQTKDVVVAGDFNSKSPEWGEDILDNRGQLLLDWAAACGLASLNVGNTPTFERGRYGSILDITFCSAGIVNWFSSWKVLKEESLIMFEVNTDNVARRVKQNVSINKSWKIGVAGEKQLRLAIKRHLDRSNITTSGDLVAAVTSACEDALQPRGRYRNRRRTVYWWTSEIAELRKNCNQA
jgi:hypothetical protein